MTNKSLTTRNPIDTIWTFVILREDINEEYETTISDDMWNDIRYNLDKYVHYTAESTIEELVHERV